MKRIGIEELKTKRDEIVRLAQLHGASHVRVFGSVARGEATEDSDVDFLVKADAQTSAWFPASLVLDLESLLGRRVEVVTEGALHWYIREKVLKEAVPL